MIFVTVGSQLPFDRLIAPVATWARARNVRDIYFQHGGTTVDLTGFDACAFMPPDEAAQMFARAKVVVAHVGVGTILACLERGTPIIVLPRKATLNETRNEHQLASARSLQAREGLRNGFHVAWEAEDLPALLDAIATLPGCEPISQHASAELLAAVRGFVFGEQGHAAESRSA